MKTKIISKLKNELLLVELPEDTQFDVLVNNPLWKDGIKFLTGTDEKFHFIKGSYTLLGTPDEIKEEDAAELIPMYYDYEKTAVEYIIEALESEIFWENPIPTPEIQGGYDDFGNFHGGWDDSWISAFQEAQEKTFDKNRTLIFVKN